MLSDDSGGDAQGAPAGGTGPISQERAGSTGELHTINTQREPPLGQNYLPDQSAAPGGNLVTNLPPQQDAGSEVQGGDGIKVWGGGHEAAGASHEMASAAGGARDAPLDAAVTPPSSSSSLLSLQVLEGP